MPDVDQAFISALRAFVGWERLTGRELEVLDARIVRGERSIAGAVRLCMAPGTFERHLEHIVEKLGYHGVARELERDLLIAYGRALERQTASWACARASRDAEVGR